MHTRLLPSVIVSLIVTGAISGCSDSPTALNSSRSLRSEADNSPAIVTPERAMLTELTRTLAIALADPKLRQSLKEDMREAPYREHKLELRKYLRGDRGTRTRDAVARKAGRAGLALLSVVDSIRPLELYMPVRAQRESWDGGESPIVLSQLAEDDEIVAFNANGKRVTLSRTIPPSQPVISLIPVETHFDQTIDLTKATNTNDRGGRTIGTLENCAPKGAKCGSGSISNGLHKLVACDVDCGGGGTAPDQSFVGAGLYLQFSRLLDAKEPWFRGDPEIEVHIHGPTDQANPQYGADLSCSGAEALDYRKVFDQNGNFWTGSVMLFSEQEATQYTNKFTEGFNILFWEDDDTSCTIKTDGNSLLDALHSTATATGAALAVKLVPAAWWVKAGAFVATLFSSADWLMTNDDFLGVAVDMTELGESFPDASHDIMLAGSSNGRARIIWRTR